MFGFIWFAINFTVGVVWSTSEENSSHHEFKLVPPDGDVARTEDESYIVSCQANKTRLRWFSPHNKWIDAKHGRVYVIDVNGSNELKLVITSIRRADQGEWRCEAEEPKKIISFNMMVYGTSTLV